MRLLSKLCSLTFFLSSTFAAFSQVAIGTGANAPNPDTNAVLLLEGNGSQGIIIPKVSSLGSFGKPGMVVYNTATGTVHYFSTKWVELGSGGSAAQGIQISGNKVSIGTGAGFSPDFSIAAVAPGANGQILMWDSSLNSGAGGWTSSATTAPSAVGQVLKWNGSRWEPGTDNTGSTTTLSGDVSGPSNNSTISLTAGNNIAAALNNAATTSKILPAQISAGAAGQVLTTTGGVAQWANASASSLPSLSANQLLSNNGTNTGINVGGDIGLSVTGTTGTFTIANNAITDSKVATGISAGKITTGTLPVAQVPNLDASKINTGTFTVAQIPSLDATKITSGTFATSQIPNLDAAKITIGTLSSARLDVGTTANKIVQLDATGKLPALDGSQLTNLPAGVETDPTVKAISGIVKSNGTTISAATAGTDYQLPLVSGTNIKTINGTSVLGAGNITAVTTETDPTVKAINGLVKSNGTTISAAAAGTDYAPATTGSSILKGNGSGGFANAVAGTDYLTNNQTITLSGDLSGAGSTTIATAIGVTAGNNIVTAINNAGTTGTINDNRLATISTAGKVSGSAINTGTIGGSTVINTTGTLTTGAATVSSLTIGSTAINWPANASGSLTNNGTGTLTWVPAGGSGTVTSITKGTGLVAGAPITTSGTIDVNVGTGANQIVQLDATGKLPAIDGSQLTNLPAGAETDPTVKAINGLVKSNGTTISAATAGTDYQAPLVSGTNIKTINGVSVLGVGNITAVTTETDPAVKAINGLVKSNGTTISAATAGTDYQAPITLTTTGTSGAATLVGNTLNVPNYAGTSYTAGTGLTLTTNTFSVNGSQNISTLSNLTTNGLIKTSGGTGALSIATAGTDYLTPTGNGSGLTSLNASNISSGTLPIAQVPSLDAAKITTGTFTAGQIPSLDAAKINTGTLPVAVGGTGANTLTGLVLGNGTSAFTGITTGANGQLLTVSGGNPTWQNAPAPSGAAGGDLLGSTYPNPVIAGGAINSAKLATSAVATSNIAPLAVTDAKINDMSPSKIAQASASSGQVLKWNGSAWAPATDNVGGGGAPTLNPGQIIVGDGTSNSAATVGQDATLNSTNGNITVQGLRGRPIDPAVPATNSVYQYNGTQWTPVVLTGGGTVSNITVGTGLSGGPNITTTGTIGIAAGGVGTTELANNAVTATKLSSDGSIDANRAVTTTHVRDAAITDAKLASGITVSKLSPGTNGQVLTVSGGIASWQTSGALTNPMTAPGDLIYGAAGGTPTRLATGTGFLKGGATPTYTSINLASADVSGLLSIANGGTNASTPAAARTNLGLGTLSTLNAVASTEITDGTIADADISGTAAIAGSKIVPAFGAQNITTTTGSGSIGGGLNVGLANGFTINNSGNITKINGATTSFPATNAVGVLTNDGAGTLTWAAGSGWGLTGNTLTGTERIGSDNAQPLAFETTNTERMRIDATGKVGIGTTTPNEKLDVAGNIRINSNDIYLLNVDGDIYHGLGWYGAGKLFNSQLINGPILYGWDGGALGIRQGSENIALRWTTAGNVGIGNIAPTEKLDITGNLKFSGALMPNNLPGTVGQVLTSAGAGIAPTWTTITGGGNMITTNNLSDLTNFSTARTNLGLGSVAYTWPATNGTGVLTNNGSGTLSWAPGGAGSVTTVSVASANGFTGTVATASSTPAITIGTSLTGLLKGNGTALSAATAGTDYQAPITLTTTGTSGAATLVGNTLNVPNYAGTSYTAGTGLTLTTNTFSVNTSQNISTLSNLTTNGLIKTSGGTGALSIATAGTDYLTPTGNGSGLTSLNASNISSGTLPVAQVPNLDASKITTGTFGSAQITDGTIADADVNASAAIAGSKINPNFGTQAISTTGTLTTGTAGAFAVNATGNITKVNNVTTSFPAANAAGVLSNDGTGTLTWAAGSGWGLTGNTLTGTERIGSDNAQPLAFETTNTERMRIDATGKVGIGTTTPNEKLDVAGNIRINSNDIYLLNVNGDFNHGLGWYGAGKLFNSQLINGPILYGWDGGALGSRQGPENIALRWTTAGNVGIGNIAPTQKLDITGNLKFSGALMPNNTAGTAGQVLTSAGAGAAPTWANASSGWGLNGNSGTTPASQFIGTTDAQDFRLRTNNLERLSINSAGNVGIGTTTPISKLNVSLGQWDLVNSEGDFSIGDGTHRLKMGVSGGGGGAGDAYIASQGGSNRLFLGNSNSLANSQTLTLVGGNVGIANTNPTEKLDITGNLKFSGALMPNNTAGTAGQVLTSAGPGAAPTWSSASSGWGLTGNSGTTPASQFIGTTDAQDFRLRTNNLERLSINSAGNVGIGQINPTAKLDILGGVIKVSTSNGGAGTQTITQMDDPVNGLLGTGGFAGHFAGDHYIRGAWGLKFDRYNFGQANPSSSDYFGGNPDAGSANFRYYTGSAWRSDMVIRGSGNVGIANTNPTEKLDITGNLKFSGALMPNNTAGAAGQVLTSAGAGAAPTWANASSGWGLTGNSGTTPASQFIGTTDAQDFRLRTNNIERLSITSSGNIGVGIINPASALDVNGSVKVTSEISASAYNNVYNLNNSFGPYFTSYKTRAGGAVLNGDELGIFDFRAFDGTTGQRAAMIYAQVDGTPAAGSVPGSLTFYTTPQGGINTERLRISAAGNVGIGTSSPSTTLHVVGDIMARGTTRTFFTTDAGAAQNNSIITLDQSAIGGFAGLLIKGNDNVTNFPTIGLSLQNSSAKAILGAGITGIPTAVTAGAETMDLTFNTKAAAGTSLERMRISSTGNVGIGTSTPQASLDVNGSGAFRANLIVGVPANGNQQLRLDPGTGFSQIQAVNPSVAFNNLALNPSGGNVGIGTTSPIYPLQVNQTALYNSASTHGVYSNPTGFQSSASNLAVGIYSSGAVLAGWFWAFSDARIKEKLSVSNTAEDLKLLMRLKVTDYSHIDKIAKGSTAQKGFIAQEVKEILPDAVNILPKSEFVPSIYSQSKSISKSDLGLRIELSKAHDLKVGDRVRLLDGSVEFKEIVTEIPTLTSFIVKNESIKASMLFIYGKEISDMHTIDYDRIYTLGVSAIQELNKKLEAQQQVIDSLQAQDAESKKKIALLEASLSKVAAGETELTNLKSEIEKIKAALGMSAEATVKKAQEKTEVRKEK